MKIFNKINLHDLILVNAVVSVLRFGDGAVIPPDPDMHYFWEIVSVKNGVFSVLIDGKRFDISEGECLIYPPLSLHVGVEPQSPEIEIISFESDSAVLSELAGRIIKTSDEQSRLLTESTALGLDILTSTSDTMTFTLFRKKGVSDATLQVLKKKIELALTSIYAENLASPQITSKGYKQEYREVLTRFLRMNLNKPITIADMARELAISVSRLKAISSEILGAPPMDYFISLKLEAATSLIRAGDLNFSEIAEALGFSSVHYFSKLFKKRLGMTPSEYAKNAN